MADATALRASIRPPRTSAVRRVAGFLCILAAGAALCGLAALRAAPRLLVVESPPAAADAIVVLGGGGPDRARAGASLFADGRAGTVLATGVDDCTTIRDALVADGVPAEAVLTECLSESTLENAAMSLPLLRAAGARRIVVVTTWFHTRRATRVFQVLGPELEVRGAPTLRPVGATPPEFVRDVLVEYAKVAWYWVRHGIAPL